MTALCSGFDDLPYSISGAFEALFCMPRVRREHGGEKRKLSGSGGRGRTACLAARLRWHAPAEFRQQSRRNVRPRVSYTNRLHDAASSAPFPGRMR